MTSMHLDGRTFRKLMAGQLDRAESRMLAEHLRDPCEECEIFLASQEAAEPSTAPPTRSWREQPPGRAATISNTPASSGP